MTLFDNIIVFAYVRFSHQVPMRSLLTSAVAPNACSKGASSSPWHCDGTLRRLMKSHGVLDGALRATMSLQQSPMTRITSYKVADDHLPQPRGRALVLQRCWLTLIGSTMTPGPDPQWKLRRGGRLRVSSALNPEHPSSRTGPLPT